MSEDGYDRLEELRRTLKAANGKHVETLALVDAVDSLSAMKTLKSLALQGVGVSLAYDHEYGIDKKSGWSVTFGCNQMSQFERTPEEAVRAALARWTEWSLSTESKPT